MEFESNEALARWMEDEGLSPFTLLKLSPKPSASGRKLPASAVMDWGIQDLEHEGEREKFLAWRVTAEALEVFRADGALDPFEECHAALNDVERGIDLRLEAGGTLHLRCARLAVSAPIARSRKGRPRPHHGEVHLTRALSSVTLGEIRAWLGIPAALHSHLHPHAAASSTDVLGDRTKVTEAPFTLVVDAPGHDLLWLSVYGDRLTVSRGKWATDELWTGVWSRLSTVPGVTQISSRDLVCAPESWPERPPPKPAPQVWPDVFGVTCDFEPLTPDQLRVCLGLPMEIPFVLDTAAGLEASPALTLGAAAREGERPEANGAFVSAAGKRLVACRVDLRESALSFHRERGCDDATWSAVWRGAERLPGARQRRSRTTCSPPDPWPLEPPAR